MGKGKMSGDNSADSKKPASKARGSGGTMKNQNAGKQDNNKASLFGRLKSTAFRFFDTKAATAPRALASLRIWHNGSSVMGSEERGGTI